MLSMTSAVLFRMAKSPALRTFTVLAAVMGLGVPAFFAAAPGLGLYIDVSGMMSSLTFVQIFGNAFLSGSALALMVTLFAAVFLVDEFKTGYVKNLVQARGDRMAFTIAHAAALLVATAWLLAVGAVALFAGLLCTGQGLASTSASDVVRGLSQALVVAAAYGMITQLVVVISKSPAMGVVAAIAIGTGFIETSLTAVASIIPAVPEGVRVFLEGYLNADMMQISSGVLAGTGAYADGVLTMIAAAGVAVLVMLRRDLA